MVAKQTKIYIIGSETLSNGLDRHLPPNSTHHHRRYLAHSVLDDGVHDAYDGNLEVGTHVERRYVEWYGRNMDVARNVVSNVSDCRRSRLPHL
jgi:hypothetical protein